MTKAIAGKIVTKETWLSWSFWNFCGIFVDSSKKMSGQKTLKITFTLTWLTDIWTENVIYTKNTSYSKSVANSWLLDPF